MVECSQQLNPGDRVGGAQHTVLSIFLFYHIVCYTTTNEEAEETSISIFLEKSEAGWCNSLMKVP